MSLMSSIILLVISLTTNLLSHNISINTFLERSLQHSWIAWNQNIVLSSKISCLEKSNIFLVPFLLKVNSWHAEMGNELMICEISWRPFANYMFICHVEINAGVCNMIFYPRDLVQRRTPGNPKRILIAQNWLKHLKIN